MDAVTPCIPERHHLQCIAEDHPVRPLAGVAVERDFRLNVLLGQSEMTKQIIRLGAPALKSSISALG